MALPLFRHLPPSTPTFLHHSSSKYSPPNTLLPIHFSLFSSSIFSLQRCRLHQHCNFIVSSSPEGSSEAVIFDAEAEQSEEKPAESRRRLIAQNIPWTSTADDIKNLFEKHGTVLDVELSMYNKSQNRGLAFINMASEEEALMALNSLNSYELNGRVIKVELSRSLNRKANRETTTSTTEFPVFVGNLAWRVRSRDLRELFETTAKAISAEVIFQSNPRRSAGYGFVSFATKEDADAAIAAHNDKILMGRKIRLIIGKPPPTNNSKGKTSENELPFEASKESNPCGELPVQIGESGDGA